MRLYVISGVAGMTGNELARQILSGNEADKVIGFDNFYASSIDTLADCLNNERFHFFEYDLNNVEQMDKISQLVVDNKTACDELVYINCAAVVHTEHFYHINETFTTNVLGMKSFLDAAIYAGAQTFINCSTSEVYSMNSWNVSGGVRENEFLTLSTAEHSQRTSYATGKLLTEFFLRDAVSEGLIQGCSIRFANVYSRNERYAKHIIPHIITSLRDTRSVVLLENSRRNMRTFLHNVDSCSAILELLKAPKSLDGSVYNVATDEEISILDLVELCAKKMGIVNPTIQFSGRRTADPERRLLSTEKIRTLTSWRPKVSLSQGLEDCIEFYCGEKNANRNNNGGGSV